MIAAPWTSSGIPSAVEMALADFCCSIGPAWGSREPVVVNENRHLGGVLRQALKPRAEHSNLASTSLIELAPKRNGLPPPLSSGIPMVTHFMTSVTSPRPLILGPGNLGFCLLMCNTPQTAPSLARAVALGSAAQTAHQATARPSVSRFASGCYEHPTDFVKKNTNSRPGPLTLFFKAITMPVLQD